ncbi:hypothetical protein AB1M95_13970 [Sulfitobacter sp. LCG007]
MRMLRVFAGACVAAAVLAGAATLGSADQVPEPGTAAEHVVIILTGGYFPEVVYARPGDTIRFVNESGREHVVTAYAPGWTTGIIEPGQEMVVPVTITMEGDYFGDSELAMKGRISFDPSPFAD